MATVATLRDLVDALIETGLENNSLGMVISDLKAFFSLLSESSELKDVLAVAVFEVGEKKEIISDICQRTDMVKETKNFLVLASEFGKLGVLVRDKDIVIRKLEQAAGKLKAEIISASPVSEDELNRIKESLNRATGKDVEISVSIDTSIIGGLITKIEGKVFDNSIKAQLERMRAVLTS